MMAWMCHLSELPDVVQVSGRFSHKIVEKGGFIPFRGDTSVQS